MYVNKTIGRLGETLACEYLLNNGYEIIKRNYNTKRGEIDIIARYKNALVFIEVKTRSNLNFGQPVEAITKKKQVHMLNTIKYYLYENHLYNTNIQIRIDAHRLTVGRYPPPKLPFVAGRRSMLRHRVIHWG